MQLSSAVNGLASICHILDPSFWLWARGQPVVAMTMTHGPGQVPPGLLAPERRLLPRSRLCAP